MDRRKLIVGGGAAAVAGTLTAVAGARMAAAAAGISGGTISTLDHVRQVLAEVNVDRGLVDPAGLQRQFDRAYAECVAAAPRDPEAVDLTAWVRERVVQMCGSDSFAVAATEDPGTRAVLAFSFLAYSQHQETTLPRLEPGARVPTVLRILERDFFPVLHEQIVQKAETSRGFAYAMQATSAELDRMVEEKVRETSGGVGLAAAQSGREGLEFTAGVLVILAVLYWIRRGTK